MYILAVLRQLTNRCLLRKVHKKHLKSKRLKRYSDMWRSCSGEKMLEKDTVLQNFGKNCSDARMLETVTAIQVFRKSAGGTKMLETEWYRDFWKRCKNISILETVMQVCYRELQRHTMAFEKSYWSRDVKDNLKLVRH